MWIIGVIGWNDGRRDAVIPLAALHLWNDQRHKCNGKRSAKMCILGLRGTNVDRSLHSLMNINRIRG